MAGDVQATWGIQVPVETNAGEAANELENLRDQLTADTQTLRNMQKAMRDLQGGTNVSIQTFRKLREGITAQKVAVAQGTQALAQMKGGFTALHPAAVRAQKDAEALRKEQESLAKTRAKEVSSGMAHVLGILSPRLGHAARGAQDFRQALGTIGASRAVAVAGIAAVAAVFLALVAATAAVTYAVGKAVKSLIEFGVAAADARREERLMLQSASATLFWGHATEFAGQQAQLAVDKVARAVPLARTEVAGFAAQLAKAQFKGQHLEKALKAVAIAASAGQDTGTVIGMLNVGRITGSIDAVADRIEKRFGAIAAARMLSLDVQTMKLKENFAALFSKVNPTPFLEAIQRLFLLFDKTSVTGYAMRETLTNVFNILGKDFKSATPIVEKLFKIMLIGILQATLSFVKLRYEINAWLDQHPKVKTFLQDTNNQIVILESTIRGLKGVFLETLFMIPAIGPALRVALAAFDAGPAIRGFIDGIVEGIKKGIARVIASVRELGHSAVAALRSVWESHSPSELTKRIARNDFAGGAAIGLRQGQPRVQDAMREVFTPANDVGQPPAPAAAPRPSRGGGKIELHFHITVPAGTTDPEAFGRAAGKGMREELDEILEEMAHAAGAQLEDDDANAA